MKARGHRGKYGAKEPSILSNALPGEYECHPLLMYFFTSPVCDIYLFFYFGVCIKKRPSIKLSTTKLT